MSLAPTRLPLPAPSLPPAPEPVEVPLSPEALRVAELVGFGLMVLFIGPSMPLAIFAVLYFGLSFKS